MDPQYVLAFLGLVAFAGHIFNTRVFPRPFVEPKPTPDSHTRTITAPGDLVRLAETYRSMLAYELHLELPRGRVTLHLTPEQIATVEAHLEAQR